MNALKISGVFLLLVFVLFEVQLQAQPRSSHHSRYRDVPRYGHRVNTAPRQSVAIRVRGTVFRYHAGLFYRPAGNTYVIVHAPIGTYIRTLPGNHFRIVVGTRVYYYYYANFYTRRSDGQSAGYVVVAPPLGARIDELPDRYHKVEIDATTYYLLHNVYYKAGLSNQGDLWYEVIGVDNSSDSDSNNY